MDTSNTIDHVYKDIAREIVDDLDFFVKHCTTVLMCTISKKDLWTRHFNIYRQNSRPVSYKI